MKTSVILDNVAVTLVKNEVAIHKFTSVFPYVAMANRFCTKARRDKWERRSFLNKMTINVVTSMVAMSPRIALAALRRRGELTIAQQELRKQKEKQNNA